MSHPSDPAACPLAERQCVPCRGGVPPLKGQALQSMLQQLDGWQVVQEHHLAKTYRFADFAGALAFANRIGELAERQQHHPDLHLSWGRLRVELHTHKIDGLHESDFILAAKIDTLPR